MLRNLSIRLKLLLAFLSFSLMTLLVVLMTFRYIHQQENLAIIDQQIDEMNRQVNELVEQERAFFIFEAENPQFIAETHSNFELAHSEAQSELISLMRHFENSKYLESFEITSQEGKSMIQATVTSVMDYSEDFHRLVDKLKTGNLSFHTMSSQRIDLEHKAEEIYKRMNTLSSIVSQKIISKRKSAKDQLWLIGISVLLLSIVLAGFFAKLITKPIVKLNTRMSKFVEDDFSIPLIPYVINSNDEIGILGKSFNLMAERLNKTLSILNEKNSELQESNEQLEKFTSIVSHDLKSPLRTMSSFVSLLQRRMTDKIGENEKEYMDFIKDGANKMTELVNDLHEYSTLNSKGLSLKSTAFEPFLNEVLQLVNYQIEETDTKIRIKSDISVFTCDTVKIRQVFQNLITNAIKYVASDVKPEIHITAVDLAKNWQFSIRDNGIGIPKEAQNKVFQPFNRAGLGQEYEGTGLGLSICKKIVVNHGGEIWVESNPAGGSVFHFTIAKQPVTENQKTTSINKV